MAFKIPAGVLAQHVIALGKTRSGKSTAVRVLVEGLLDVDKPVCIVDPKGDWWGIKSSADGKRAGYALVIFGGEHADVPINEHSGAAVAELIATGNRSCLIDLGGWMVGERTRFFVAFASTLFKLARGARHLVIDEVHNFAPQGKILDPDAGKMLHWANRLASEGLGKGIVILAASQRPQKVHKDFLTSCETLIAKQVIHKLDRVAIKDWIDGCADPDKGKEVIATLAQLKKPQAWIWSPEIEYGPTLVEFPLFRTFDSFKPQPENAAPVSGWAAVDLDQVKEKLAKVVEEAKANDPAALRKRIAELERQLAARPAAAADPAAVERAHKQGYAQGVDAAREALMPATNELQGAFAKFKAALAAAASIAASPARSASTHVALNKPPAKGTRLTVAEMAPKSNGRAADLPAGEAAVLSAVLWYPAGIRRNQLTVITGYKRSTRDAYIQRLRERGYVQANGDAICATSAGMAAMPTVGPLPSGEALQQFWREKLPAGERRVLDQLITFYPDACSRDVLSEATGFQRSTRDAYLQRLAAKNLVIEPERGKVKAARELFA